jgi:hypothetical protein
MKLSGEELGYLAGMVDGEGSVMLYRNSHDKVIRLVIQVVVSTNLQIVEKVRSLLIKAGYKYGVTHTKENTAKGYRGAWMLQLRRIDDQKRFISEVGPSVSGKAEQLRVASAFLARRNSRRKTKPNVEDDLLVAYMKTLNVRGLSADTVTTARDADFLSSLKIQSELYGDVQSVAEMTTPGLPFESE